MRAHINGENLHYELAGRGAPLALIHGWTLDLRMWNPQVEILSRRFRVIRYDRRGFGQSSGQEDAQWDAADLSALLDHLHIDRAHVLGMSQGGNVAMRFARRFPERTASLILHGSTAPEGFPLPWNGSDRVPMTAWQKLAQNEGLERFREVWRIHPAMHVSDDLPDVRRHLQELLAAYPGRRLLHPSPSTGPIESVTMDDLPHLTLQTLVLIGDEEIPYLQIVARTLAYYLPNATLTVIPGGGHLINLEQPEDYNAAIVKFLDGVERAA